MNKCIEDAIWCKICDHFVTKKEVFKLTKQLQEVDNNSRVNKNAIIEAVSAEIKAKINSDLEAIKKDFEDQLKDIHSFEIIVVNDKDKFGRPAVEDPQFNTIYLCPSEMYEYNNCWDEWMIVKKDGQVEWERIGNQAIKLKHIKNDIDALNKGLSKLNCRVNKFSKEIGDLILEKCIRPLKEIEEYIKSPEFKKEVAELIPVATAEQDGLISKESFADLQRLIEWKENELTVEQVQAAVDNFWA